MDRMTWVISGGGTVIVIPIEVAHLWQEGGGSGYPMGRGLAHGGFLVRIRVRDARGVED
jgi:hypothetical protein